MWAVAESAAEVSAAEEPDRAGSDRAEFAQAGSVRAGFAQAAFGRVADLGKPACLQAASEWEPEWFVGSEDNRSSHRLVQSRGPFGRDRTGRNRSGRPQMRRMASLRHPIREPAATVFLTTFSTHQSPSFSSENQFGGILDRGGGSGKTRPTVPGRNSHRTRTRDGCIVKRNTQQSFRAGFQDSVICSGCDELDGDCSSDENSCTLLEPSTHPP